MSQSQATASDRELLSSSPNNNAFGFCTLVLDVGTPLNWDGEYWEIINPGTHRVYLQKTDGKTTSLPNNEFFQLFEKGHITGLERKTELDQKSLVQEILNRARPQDIQTASNRYEAIRPYLGDHPEPITKVNRTLRRWRDNYQNSEKLYGKGNGYVGLIPRHLDKGHNEKLDPTLVAFMDKFIEEHYFTPKNRRISAVYRDFKQACQIHEPKLEVPSLKRFSLQIKRKSNNYQLIKDKHGSRVAKQSKPFHATTGMPRHGELPWESAHIDHTPIDIELVSSLLSLATCNTSSALTESDINLGRCWATLMVDSYCKRIQAVYLSFEEPSYRSCMMVIRICVQS